MEPPLELPDLPQNAELLDFLRGQAMPPSGAHDYTLGGWELHTHPDVMDRLGELAPGWPMSAAYGVPLLARDGVAAVVALGTGWLAVRIGQLPAHVETREPATAWTFAHDDWHVVEPWPSELSAADGTRVLQDLVRDALAYAGTLRRSTGRR